MTTTPDYRAVIRERLCAAMTLVNNRNSADAAMAVIEPLIVLCDIQALRGGRTALRRACGIEEKP